jgi:hypothetical protein
VNEEDNVITGLGSMLLQNPLQFDHSVGEIVLNLNPTAVEEINSDIPSDYVLYNNYPNPFNPSTTINFSVLSSEFVTLKVFDVLGNEVAVLVDEEKPAGIYEVKFDAIGLSSGIYFYKLQAGSFVETKKMILMK